MSRTHARLAISAALIGLLPAAAAAADTTFFDTGKPDGKIATATRPESSGKFEIELADDFVLKQTTSITDATFTGLLTGANPTVGEVRVEIYRVFPKDSDVGAPAGRLPSRRRRFRRGPIRPRMLSSRTATRRPAPAT